MDVRFVRTGARRYAIVARPAGGEQLIMDPAPGYDSYLPHDLVHYAVEAELGLRLGIYGRLASGGSGFRGGNAAAQRKRKRREAALRTTGHADMARSEALTSLLEIVWKVRHGLLGEVPVWCSDLDPAADQGQDAERVLRLLDKVAFSWTH